MWTTKGNARMALHEEEDDLMNIVMELCAMAQGQGPYEAEGWGEPPRHTKGAHRAILLSSLSNFALFF